MVARRMEHMKLVLFDISMAEKKGAQVLPKASGPHYIKQQKVNGNGTTLTTSPNQLKTNRLHCARSILHHCSVLVGLVVTT